MSARAHISPLLSAAVKPDETHRLLRERNFMVSVPIDVLLAFLREHGITGELRIVIHQGGIRAITLHEQYVVAVEKRG